MRKEAENFISVLHKAFDLIRGRILRLLGSVERPLILSFLILKHKSGGAFYSLPADAGEETLFLFVI